MRLATLLCCACGSVPPPPVSAEQPRQERDYRIELQDDGRERVIDLQPPFRRSYFSIVLVDDGAALVPRPDDEIAAACTRRDVVSAVAKRNGLCKVETSGAAFVKRINSLSITDALLIKRGLERAQRFCVVSQPQSYVDPLPLDRDVWNICQQPRSGLSEALCEFHSPAHVTLEGRIFSTEENLRLAARLNALYGIAVTETCATLDVYVRSTGQIELEEAPESLDTLERTLDAALELSPLTPIALRIEAGAPPSLVGSIEAAVKKRGLTRLTITSLPKARLDQVDWGAFYQERARGKTYELGPPTAIEAVYGDLDGDGDDEAVVHVSIPDDKGDVVEIYRLRGGKPQKLGQVPGGWRSAGGVRSIEIRAGAIWIERTQLAANDAMALPSRLESERWLVRNDKLEEDVAARTTKRITP